MQVMKVDNVIRDTGLVMIKMRKDLMTETDESLLLQPLTLRESYPIVREIADLLLLRISAAQLEKGDIACFLRGQDT